MNNKNNIINTLNKIYKLHENLDKIEKKKVKITNNIRLLKEKLKTFSEKINIPTIDFIAKKLFETLYHAIKSRKTSVYIEINNKYCNKFILHKKQEYNDTMPIFLTFNYENPKETYFINLIDSIKEITDDEMIVEGIGRNILKIPLTEFTENKNINKDQFLKFVELFREYKRIYEELKDITDKTIIYKNTKIHFCIVSVIDDIYYITASQTTEKKNKKTEEKELNEFINKITKLSITIKEFMKKINEANIAYNIINKIKNNYGSE